MKLKDMTYKLDPDLFKMLKFADADVFTTEDAKYEKKQIIDAFDTLVTRLKVKMGLYNYCLGKSKVLTRTFGTEKSVKGKKEVWELLLTKII
jgi:hypothetical protein